MLSIQENKWKKITGEARLVTIKAVISSFHNPHPTQTKKVSARIFQVKMYCFDLVIFLCVKRGNTLRAHF